MLYCVTKQEPDAGGTRGCDGSDEQTSIRKPLFERTNQRRCGLNLTDRHSMHPDAAIDFREAKSKTLPEIFGIGAVADAAHQPVARKRYKQEVGKQVVEKAHDGLRLFVFEPVDNAAG